MLRKKLKKKKKGGIDERGKRVIMGEKRGKKAEKKLCVMTCVCPNKPTT